MSLAQAMSQTFGKHVGINTVLQHTAVSAQAEAIEQVSETGLTQPLEPYAEDRTPVSVAQERLLFIDEFEGGTAAYNIPLAVCVPAGEQVDDEQVVAAVHALIARHDALRTLIARDVDNSLILDVQPVKRAAELFAVQRRRVTDRQHLDRFLEDDANYVFDLASELPIRCSLNQFESGELVLSLVLHHTCFDGWSWTVVREELAALLASRTADQLPPVTASYAHFAHWQRQQSDPDRQADLATFWVTRLSAAPTVQIPGDHARPERFDYLGRERRFDLDAQTLEGLEHLAQQARVSLYSVLLAAWGVTLTCYSGQEDIVVATPLAGRGRPEFARTVGFFANLLAIRFQVDPDLSVTEYVALVGREVLDAQMHGDLPFEQLVRELGVEPDTSRHPVTGINFTLQEIDSGASEQIFTEYLPDTGGRTVTKFDLSTTLIRAGDRLTGNLTYAASIYDDATAGRLIDTFTHLLRAFAIGAESQRLGEVSLTIAPAGCEPSGCYDQRRSLADRFESMVDGEADWPAVIAAEPSRRMTYLEVDHAANQVAHLLRSVGVGSGDLVALTLDKSAWTPIAILATWKSGAGYVPIDPGSPSERVAFMLTDTDARAVLTEPTYADRMRELASVPVLDITADAHGQPHSRPAVPRQATDPAYAIYTSGTTGAPKAVLVTHESLDSFRAEIAERYFGPPSEQRQAVLMMSNYAFDFSVEQLALSLLTGHTLVIPPTLLDPTDEGLYSFLEEAEVSYLSGTPTQMHQLDLAKIPHLQAILVAGEAFQRAHFDKIRRDFAGTIYSAYGTTETSVYNLVDVLPPEAPYRSVLGQPMGNTGWQVWAAGSSVTVPVGGVGELVLTGPCVTRGYLNRDELTSEAFARIATSPMSMYRTGDLVRVRSDGELVFLGRRDAQVKVRGLRVELGEVEAALTAASGVAECVVQVRQLGGADHLIGYYAPKPGAVVDSDMLIESARARLADALIPSMLVELPNGLPLTVNGKRDIAALPDPDPGDLSRDRTPPRTRLEARLCDVWAQHLPVEVVGPQDDFFRVGGDSISALHLSSHVQRELGRKISVRAIFDHPTVQGFLEHALGAPSLEPEVPAETGRLTGACPVTPIQQWFHDKDLAEPNCWNQYLTIRVPELDLPTLRRAVEELVAYHDVFRLRVHRDPRDSARQEYADTEPGIQTRSLDVGALGWAQVQRQLHCWQSEFELESGPIGTVAYLHGLDDGARVYLAAHHLILDTVSWQILTRDLEILYNGGRLEEKSASLRQWSMALQDYPADAAEVALWEEVVQSLDATPAQLRSVVAPSAATREETWLSKEQTRALLTESGRAYDSDINDLLLAGVGMALHALTGSETNHVTVEGHGRERFPGAPDVRDTVGWFTTMYPSQLVTTPGDLGATIRATRDFRRRVPHHGLGYGVLRGAYGRPQAPLPPVTFNYLGQLETGSGPSTHRWQLDLLGSGSYTDPANSGSNTSSVDVTMSVVDGRLRTVLRATIGNEQTQLLATELDRALQRIIRHTSAPGPAKPLVQEGTPEPYVLVNEDAPHTLFVLPPGEGGAESYLSSLARHLKGRRLVLFDNVHLRSPMGSFGELAEYYLAQVRELQSSGPYSFLGWSFGGVLAVEMCARLAASGQQVEQLGLIDPYFEVPYASELVGLGEATDLLDPINYHHRPDREALRQLGDDVADLVLFQATQPNEIVTGPQQRRLFDHYLSTTYNHLDRLLPADRIEVVPLVDSTHHSWVRSEGEVRAMAQRLSVPVSRRSPQSAGAS